MHVVNSASDLREGRAKQFPSSVFSRHGWRIIFCGNALANVQHATLRWTDPKGVLQLSNLTDGSDRALLRFFDLAAAWVSLKERTIEVFPLQPDLSDHTFEHFVMDVVLPRVIADAGSLVIHGSLVAQGRDGICLIGESGVGKSTLAAALRHAGWVFHGDDALVLAANGDQISAAATYPSLRLFSDSLENLFQDQSASVSPVADYLDKLRVDPQDAADPTEPSQLRAVFHLGGETSTGEPTVRRLTPSKLCMTLVAQSFALDPTDSATAHNRLSAASAAAAMVPGYELNYPRDFARLPEVIDLLRSTLDQATATANQETAAASALPNRI